MNQEKKSGVGSILIIALKLFIVCTIVAAIVAGVNALTKDRIAEAENAKRTQTLDSVFAAGEETVSYVPIETEYKGTVTALYEAEDAEENTLGYGVLCAPMGFKDNISMLVAFDTEGKILAVRIISLAETTGIGDKVKKDPSFVEQFEGKQNAIVLGSDGVAAIAGSTISSKAVTKGVNDAISQIKSYLATATATEEA